MIKLTDEQRCNLWHESNQDIHIYSRAIEAEFLRINGGGGEVCDYPDCKCPTESPCLKGLPQPQQTEPENIVFNNPSYEPWLREQAAHMQVTGPLHVVRRCDSCKASQQAAPGAVLEGYVSVPAAAIDILVHKFERAGGVFKVAHFGVELGATSWCVAVSDALEVLAAAAAPKPQGE